MSDVQGVVFDQNAAVDTSFVKGQEQEKRCRDPAFAVLFYIQLVAITAIAVVYGRQPFQEALDTDDQNQNVSAGDFAGYIYAAVMMSGAAVVLSALMLSVMLRIPSFLIKASLIFVVVLSGLSAVAAVLSGAVGAAIPALIVFAIGLCYARAAWPRIPFATANLVTATTAIKSNCGVAVIAYFLIALTFGWNLLWILAVLGVFETTSTCTTDPQTGLETCDQLGSPLMFVLLISYFFTFSVLQNVVHVTVAGTVGTWWFVPEEGKACCSSGVYNSLYRSLTTSFGSICFGSLVVAIVQALRQMVHSARQQEGGILLCLLECIIACIEDIIEYFNKWAFVYVGLYGYSYFEAGKNVFSLFRNRGWDAIIADNLVGNALFLVSLVVGGLTGGVGIAIAATPILDDAAGNATLITFFIGFLVGLVICSVLMSVVGSGVNTVIVLYAEAPAEFQQNYPELSNQMREAWQKVYPGLV